MSFLKVLLKTLQELTNKTLKAKANVKSTLSGLMRYVLFVLNILYNLWFFLFVMYLHTINTSLVYPDARKCAKEIPLQTALDYRPKGILPILSQAFENIFKNQLNLYLYAFTIRPYLEEGIQLH